jgi:hypothetical protein
MQILIDIGKRQGIVDIDGQRFPHWLQFMKGWTRTEIEEYCQRKHWKYEILATIEDKDSYFIHDWD